MDTATAYHRAVTPASLDAASNIVRGKAISYQSEQVSSIPDAVAHRGQRYSVKEDQRLQNPKPVSKDKNERNVAILQNIDPSNIPTSRERAADAAIADGIVFSREKSSSHAEKFAVCRTPGERLRNPERLNLDRRNLNACLLLDGEEKLRLLNYQNNNIKMISNLENLPQLIFLDLYNNLIESLEGPLCVLAGLRVLMAGKNRISQISNLGHLKKLDVLDLHSNGITEIKGLESQTELRVLNLAGNQISQMNSLSCLRSLTELNIRRNCIETVSALDCLPALQRVFLSHNFIASIRCLLSSQSLIELSLDGNPLSEADPTGYRRRIIESMPRLRHLDLKVIGPDERILSLPTVLKDASSLSEEEEKEDDGSRDEYRERILNRKKVTLSSCNQDAVDSFSESVARTAGSWNASGGDPSSVDDTTSVKANGASGTYGERVVTSITPVSASASQKSSSTVRSVSIPIPQTEIAGANRRTACPSNDSITSRRSWSGRGSDDGAEGGSDSTEVLRQRLNSITTGLLSVTPTFSQPTDIDHMGSQSQKTFSAENPEVGTGPIEIRAALSKSFNMPGGGYDATQRKQRRVILAEGEGWKWPYSMTDRASLGWLREVTEVSIRHISVAGIRSQILEHTAYLPAVSVIQLLDNNIITLTQDFVELERLSVLNNPVCVSERSLRSYVVKLLPKLKYYNDVVISNEERNSSGLVVVSEFLSSILADSDIGSGSLHLKSSEVRTGRRSIEWSESHKNQDSIEFNEIFGRKHGKRMGACAVDDDDHQSTGEVGTCGITSQRQLSSVSMSGQLLASYIETDISVTSVSPLPAPDSSSAKQLTAFSLISSPPLCSPSTTAVTASSNLPFGKSVELGLISVQEEERMFHADLDSIFCKIIHDTVLKVAKEVTTVPTAQI